MRFLEKHLTISRGDCLQLLEGGVKIQRNIAETSAILQFTEDIKFLKDAYFFKQAKEIESYLWNNQFLLDILFEAREQTINIFGKNIELHLEMNRDYEEDFEELFIVIKSLMKPTHMIDLLDRLDEEWFLDISSTAKGKLNITIEPL